MLLRFDDRCTVKISDLAQSLQRSTTESTVTIVHLVLLPVEALDQVPDLDLDLDLDLAPVAHRPTKTALRRSHSHHQLPTALDQERTLSWLESKVWLGQTPTE